MTASSEVMEQLQRLESTSNVQERSEGYNAALTTILKSFQDDDLTANLVAYVQSVLSDSIGVINSRPLLTTFIESFRALSNRSVQIEAGTAIIRTLAPKIVSYEQQDTDLKHTVADAYEAVDDFTNSAKTLQTITLDSTQRAITSDDKARLWLRITRCYLEDDDPTSALTHLNKIKQLPSLPSDPETRLQFQLSQARISDSNRAFLDASTSYHTLSLNQTVDTDERLQALSAAMTTAVLAPAGPQRARQLHRLYTDERADSLPEHPILEKITLDRLLDPAEVAAFASGLQEHQLAHTADGSTVLDKAVLEHNLLAVSRLYENVLLAALGPLLGVDGEKAEMYAATMIEGGRLGGWIDQIDGTVVFAPNGRAGEGGMKGGEGKGVRGLRDWERNVTGLAEEVERVASLLVKEGGGAGGEGAVGA